MRRLLLVSALLGSLAYNPQPAYAGSVSAACETWGQVLVSAEKDKRRRYVTFAITEALPTEGYNFHLTWSWKKPGKIAQYGTLDGRAEVDSMGEASMGGYNVPRGAVTRFKFAANSEFNNCRIVGKFPKK